MKYLFIIGIVVAFFVFRGGDENPAPVMAEVEAKNKSVFVLLENGGSVALEEQADALDTALHLLQQLAEYGKRRATREVQINLITTALPNRIAWSGTAEQLLKQVESVKAILEFKQSFSDLGMAFETIRTTISIQRPEHISLYTIGPFINVPFQNSGAPIEVKVPQTISQDLALAQFMDRIHALKFYRVHPDQIPELNHYLTLNGVQKRAVKGELEFSLLGAAQTRSNLNNLL